MASNSPVWYWDAGRQRLFQIRPHPDGFYWMVFADIPSQQLTHPLTHEPLRVREDINREIPRLFRPVSLPTSSAGDAAGSSALPHQYVNQPQAYQHYPYANVQASIAAAQQAAALQAMQAQAAANHQAAQASAPNRTHQSSRVISGRQDGQTSERLDPSYQLRPNTEAQAFFRLGKVFQVLWHEPAGSNGQTNVTNFAIGRFKDELVYSKIRRFVVIREGHRSCTAIPISTYNGRGLANHGVRKSEHGIIHTGREAPQLNSNEQPARGEAGVRPRAIRVVPTRPTEALDPLSRINFGKVYTVEFNIKARDFGDVQASDIGDALLGQFRDVFLDQA